MVGLCALLAAIAGVVAWQARHHTEVIEVPRPGSSASLSQDTAEVLAGFESAVRDRDPRAVARWGPDGDELLPALVENAVASRVRGFSLRLVETGTPKGDGRFSAQVAATWTYAGFDAAPVRTEIDARLVHLDSGIRLLGFGRGSAPLPVWLAGPAQIRREEGLLVVSQRSVQETDALTTYARRAVPIVQRLLPRWRGRLVVEVPGRGGVAAALGASPGEYDNIAAVTTAQDGSTAPDAPVHVFVNAEVLARLRPEGAQVVLSHEATHVATDAPGSTLPSWAVEGFADYVALRDVDLPLSVTAGRIARVVGRDGLPDALPDAAAFAPGAPDLEAAYESAWMAWRVLGQQLGDQAVVSLYQGAERGGSMDEALTAAGIPAKELTRRWRAALAELTP